MLEESLGLMPVLYGKESLSRETMRAYWRDIHGVFVAKHFGPSSYRQLHFADYDNAVWGSDSVSRALPGSRSISGIAEFIFPTAPRMRAWEVSSGPFASSDDGNVFSRSAAYTISPGGIRNLKGFANVKEFDESSVRVFAMLHAKEPGEAFKTYVTQRLAAGIAASTRVTGVRVIALNPYEIPDWLEGASADRSLKPLEQHHATLELVFLDETSRRQFFEQAFQQLVDEFAANVSVVHAYRVQGAYTLIADSEVTMSGWLGGESAKLVNAADAANIRAALADYNKSLPTK